MCGARVSVGGGVGYLWISRFLGHLASRWVGCLGKYQGYPTGRWDWGLLEDEGCQSAHEWLGECPRAHLLCRIIILWLPRLVEIQNGVGAQADGADGRVVEWPVLMGLGSGYQGWKGQEYTPPHPLGFKGAPQLGTGR